MIISAVYIPWGYPPLLTRAYTIKPSRVGLRVLQRVYPDRDMTKKISCRLCTRTRVPYPGTIPGHPTGVPYPGTLPGYPTRATYPGTLPGHPTRAPYPGTLPGHPTRVPYPSTLPEYPTRVPYPGTLPGYDKNSQSRYTGNAARTCILNSKGQAFPSGYGRLQNLGGCGAGRKGGGREGRGQFETNPKIRKPPDK